MRSLAHIEKIIDIQPIEGADKIEVATVLGWEVVVKKEEFKVGDLCCYIEIDSIVPPTKYFEFMEPRKYRVRTIKLRKQISQGLLVSLDSLPEFQSKYAQGIGYYFEEGEDVTDLIGITKYESPSDRESNIRTTSRKKYNWFTRFMTRFNWYRKLTKQRSKSFPEWLKKTDEPRIQNMPSVLRDRDNDWIASEKIDGCSMSVYYIHKLFPKFGICSRNVRKFEFDNSDWSLCAKQFDIKNKALPKDYAIQGEIISDKIQGGKYRSGKVTKPFDFYVFNVYDIKENRYLSLSEAIEFCSTTGLKHVPIIYRNVQLLETVKEMLEQAEGRSVLADTEREGLVWRKEDQSKSFKVVSNKFLLKDK